MQGEVTVISEKIESDFSEGRICSFIDNIKQKDLSELLDEEESLSTIEIKSLSTSVLHLEVEFGEIIKDFYKKWKQDSEFKCCSCERLLVEKALTLLISLQKILIVLHGCSGVSRPL